MHLTSVRALKQELKEKPILPRAFARALKVPVASMAIARGADTVHTRSPASVSYALGVVRGKSKQDYRLGARIQAKGARARALAEEIRARTHGEAEIRLVPRVTKRSPPPSWFRRRHRPLEAGLSVGHFAITAGTIGFIVEDDDGYYVLSNNHVLANVNQGQPGDPVLQPGPADRRPAARNLVGVLDRFVPISFVRSNVVDCAVAELMNGIEYHEGWTEAIGGLVVGAAPITVDDLGLEVRKAGRTTGVTRGTITQVEIDRLTVDMGEPGRPEVALFSDQFEVVGMGNKPFSLAGDSGSLIVDKRRRARGLLFAGGPDENGVDLTYANRIERVLSKLGVKLTL